jgi:hypothetical protein
VNYSSIFANSLNNPINQGKIKPMSQEDLVEKFANMIVEMYKKEPSAEKRLHLRAIMDGVYFGAQLAEANMKRPPKGASGTELLEKALIALASPRKRVAERDEAGNIISSTEYPLT